MSISLHCCRPIQDVVPCSILCFVVENMLLYVRLRSSVIVSHLGSGKYYMAKEVKSKVLFFILFQKE